jgi:hypothetical protein
MPALFEAYPVLSSHLYGGNKVRKREFIQADARRLGMGTALVLVPQTPNASVQQNLLLSYFFGADIHCVPNTLMAGRRTLALFARQGRA